MKIKVTGRFYLVLALIVLLVVFLFRDALFASSEVASVYGGSATDMRQVQCVIVRDEIAVTRSPSTVAMIKYVARENSKVNVGDPVAEIYMNGTSVDKRIQELNEVRQSIQEEHKRVLGEELDSSLNVLNLDVQQRAEELKALVNGEVRGNLLQAVDNLNTAMEKRRNYLNSNRRQDVKLANLYTKEEEKLRHISTTVKNAPRSGVVSFYPDGYEQTLNADTVDGLSIADIRAVLNGERLDEAPKTIMDETIFRVMDPDHWYIVLLGTSADWNPKVGTTYSFVVEGYEDVYYEGTVKSDKRDGSTVMAVLEVNQDIGSLMYLRCGNVSIGANVNGLIVPKKAIDTQSGQKGVWKYDVPGGTFVAVEILADRGDGTVLISPLEGTLTSGDQVLIK